jgi:DNA-binding GntR family transcriptional regulator
MAAAAQPSVAEALREAILRGDYAPGQRLVEAELTATFGASRPAIREALRLLSGDGLIDLELHRTAQVRQLTSAQAAEIADLREVVESYVARRAAQRAKADDIAGLRQNIEDMRQAIADFDVENYSRLNEELHERIAKIAAQSEADAVLRRLSIQLTRFNRKLSLHPGRPIETLTEHEKIVKAIASHDPDRAEAAMRMHLAEMAGEIRALNSGQ